jgi:hypothetical protein
MSEKKPQVNSRSAKELENVQRQFDNYEKTIDSLTKDQMDKAPLKEVEPQTKLSQKEISKAPDIYIKPSRSLGSQERFNEDYREQWNFAKEYVHFTAENIEIKGERIEFWTKPFAGVPAEFWQLPVNKPIWAPRYVAERVRGCVYHRLKMDESQINSEDGMATQYGVMIVDHAIRRLNAEPVISRPSVFMGATGF